MTTEASPRLPSALSPVSYAASALVTLAGVLVLLGWALDVAALRSLVPGAAAVHPATAASLVLSGAALGLLPLASKEPRLRRAVHRAAMAAAAVVTAAGGLTLLGYLLGRDLGIDQLLFRAQLGGGRIGAGTALNLVLIGAALMLLSVETPGGHRPAQIVVLPAAIQTLLVLIGYVYNAHASPAASVSSVLMPLGTALAFAALSVGILFSHPDRGLMQVVTSASPTGIFARRLLLVTTAFLLLLGLVTIEGRNVGVYDAPSGVALLVAASLVLLVALIWWYTRALHLFDLARKQAEEGLGESTTQLSSWVGELEQRNEEIKQLSEIGNLLQSCVTPDEAYTVINQAAHRLFPSRSGAVYVVGPPGDLLDTVAVWGAFGPLGVFTTEECWALRRGRPHVVDDSRSGPVCPHLSDAPPSSYVCVPMMAQGEALGVFHLQSGPVGQGEHGASLDRLVESEHHLAATVADEIALSLANVRLRETLRAQAIRDSLTGVFNRRYMEESLERELRRAARKEYPVGIIMLDLDHFKRFNDTFGYEAGDTVLRALGAFLRTHIRKEDIACRYGGEEFVLIMPEAPLEVGIQRAEQLREEFKQLEVSHQGRPLGEVSLSLGVAIFPEHGLTAEPLLRVATEALSLAKAEGRDRVKTVA